MKKDQANKMAVGLTSATAKKTKQSSSKRKNPSKLGRILQHLAKGNSINRFEAEKINDHCLNTTISIIQNVHGIIIERRREDVPCLNGLSKVSVNRYWLAPNDINKQKAIKVLKKLAGDRASPNEESTDRFDGGGNGSGQEN